MRRHEYKCNECGEYHVTGAKNMKKQITVKYVPTEYEIEVKVQIT